eukprot:12401790-Karenia_brevis.AAC.1
MDMPKDQRDMLGRWIPEQSNDYLRTARATVIAIQNKVSFALRCNDVRFSEDEVLDLLRTFLEEKGLAEAEIGDILQDLRWKALPVEERQEVPPSPTVSVAADASDVSLDEAWQLVEQDEREELCERVVLEGAESPRVQLESSQVQSGEGLT